MWFWLACAHEPVSDPITPEPTPVTPEPTVPEPTLPEPPIPTQTGPDCSVRPTPTVVGYRSEPWPSEDFAFAADGSLWGIETQSGAVYRMREDGAPNVLIPYLTIFGWTRGMRFLPDGDLVVASPDDGALLRTTAPSPSRHIVRVLPDGAQEEVADLDGTASLLISAVNFGSGVGGWERDHLYVMSLWAGVYEIDVGIEGKWEPHLH